MSKIYNVVGNCVYCGKEYRGKKELRELFFCSRECYLKYLSENMYFPKKTTKAGEPVTKEMVYQVYEGFVYRYYFKLLYVGKTKEEKLSDAWYCYIKMMEEYGEDDKAYFYSVIRKYAYHLLNRMYYEKTKDFNEK